MSRRYRWVTALVFIGFLVHNIGFLVHNQRKRKCSKNEKLCKLPRILERAAAKNVHYVIRSNHAVYYHLEERIGGATLTIPPWLKPWKWYFERVARLKVTVADSPLLINRAHVKRLRRASTARRELMRRDGGWTRKEIKELNLLLAGPDVEYVLAETEDVKGPLFLMPALEYEQTALAARPGGQSL